MTFSHQARSHYLKGLQAKLYVESLEIISVPTESCVNHIFDQKKKCFLRPLVGLLLII